jgi:hypothetical protein
VLNPVDELGLQSLHITVLMDIGHAVQQVLEHDPNFHAGQVGAQTEVRSATAKGNVRVGVAPDIE